jgi:hypothetical protein
MTEAVHDLAASDLRPKRLHDRLAGGEWDLLIDYSRKDQAFATRLHAFPQCLPAAA